jgi:Holliday junction resolvase RusA-like endonuclease
MWSARTNQAELMDALADFKGMAPITTPCRIDIVFCFKAKSVTSPQIGDLDNLTKAVWDGLVQTGLIKDDRLIVASHTHKKVYPYDEIQITASAPD